MDEGGGVEGWERGGAPVGLRQRLGVVATTPLNALNHPLYSPRLWRVTALEVSLAVVGSSDVWASEELWGRKRKPQLRHCRAAHGTGGLREDGGRSQGRGS